MPGMNGLSAEETAPNRLSWGEVSGEVRAREGFGSIKPQNRGYGAHVGEPPKNERKHKVPRPNTRRGGVPAIQRWQEVPALPFDKTIVGRNHSSKTTSTSKL